MAKDIRNLLYLSCFIDLFGVSFIVPILGVHLRSLGFSNSLIGLISSVYGGIQLFSGPIVGSWSDIYGRRNVLCFTLIICALAYMSLSFTLSFSLVLSTRIIIALMKHTQTICKSLVADFIPSDKQLEIQGKLNSVASLGFMVGPVIGGHIAELENGFQYICCATTVMFLLNSLIVYFLFPDKEIRKGKQINKCNSDSNALKHSILKITTDLYNVDWKNYWDVFLLKFILGISLSLFHANYYVFVEETFSISPKYIGYTVSFQGLVSAASGMQIKIFNNFYKDNSTKTSFLKVYHCFIISTLSYIALHLSSNLYVFLSFLLPLSGSASLIRIITTELLLEKCDSHHRGSLMGASNSVSSSTRMIAPLLTGVIQDYFQASNITLFAFLLSLFDGNILLTRLLPMLLLCQANDLEQQPTYCIKPAFHHDSEHVKRVTAHLTIVTIHSCIFLVALHKDLFTYLKYSLTT